MGIIADRIAAAKQAQGLGAISTGKIAQRAPVKTSSKRAPVKSKAPVRKSPSKAPVRRAPAKRSTINVGSPVGTGSQTLGSKTPSKILQKITGKSVGRKAPVQRAQAGVGVMKSTQAVKAMGADRISLSAKSQYRPKALDVLGIKLPVDESVGVDTDTSIDTDDDYWPTSDDSESSSSGGGGGGGYSDLDDDSWYSDEYEEEAEEEEEASDTSDLDALMNDAFAQVDADLTQAAASAPAAAAGLKESVMKFYEQHKLLSIGIVAGLGYLGWRYYQANR